MTAIDQGSGRGGHRGLFWFDKIATGIATGRIKIDRDLEGRYRLMLRGLTERNDI